MKKDFCFSLKCMLLIAVMNSGCSEFNRPVVPDTFFTQYAKDSGSDTWIFLSKNGKGAEIDCEWFGFDSVDAKFFLKGRKENEFITAPLSSLPFDLLVDLRLDASVDRPDRLFADIDYFDRNGKKYDEADGGALGGRRVKMTFGNFIDESHVQVYFWQFEFYIHGDTVRLPKNPGMWCIVPDWKINSN